VWDLAGQRGVGRLILVTKMDGENIDFDKLVASIKETFGAQCVPLFLPVGQGPGFDGVVNALSLPKDVPAGVVGDAAAGHEAIMDAIVQTDDSVMERYLEGKEIKPEELQTLLSKAVAGGQVVPILCCSARKQIGVQEVLNAIVSLVPSPDTIAPRKAVDADKNEELTVAPTVNAPLAGQVFKSVTDPFVGKLSFIRILAGKMEGEFNFHNARTRRNERVTQILQMFGKEQRVIPRCIAGDIIAVCKVEDIAISDTICDQKKVVKFPEIVFPTPMVSLAVEPKSRGDEGKISTALTKLSDEDKTFRVSRDRQTHELVITGMSALHLDVMISRLKRRFDVQVNTKQPKIPYKETITGKSDTSYKHKKQTGGRGQYGEVYIRIEPLARGVGFEFVDDVVGGTVPQQYVPAVEKGVRECMEKGILAGYPIEDVRVALYDGSYHVVDSSEAAFKIASSIAFQDAFMKAKPVLLEPVVNIEITVPGEFVGEIMGNLTSRRGRIAGTDQMGNLQIIRAQVPMAEIAKYGTELKSMTGGQGSYSIEFSHYDVVPSHLTQAIVAQSKKEQEEKK
ncbi:MAG: elongation factor G, partial [Planctomycetes bacterium]|nr:elongation factor G [Planctomycetota bacterium]